MDKVFKALGDPTRRQILQLLQQREMTAGEIAEHFALAKPTLSGHFNVLREADLVMSDKQGTTITYRLNLSTLEEALLGFADAFGLGSGTSGTSGTTSATTSATTGRSLATTKGKRHV
ncbi:autorepressor SdpR family transcription factor [Aquabacterium sp. OR-4]|uniref:autorepressor SdpR family transcription factor n=1 Tax=Aquabacterium sp. OR-4 TaxID=2978127 RepID=UPI0021B46059|nr:autorepressor SdpR family transcription factor [Aquabacterium sp. OR-4]MDT7837531.1 autorepressor SdpR family transcription factor [Aquabacterium sp. OR-4]